MQPTTRADGTAIKEIPPPSPTLPRYRLPRRPWARLPARVLSDTTAVAGTLEAQAEDAAAGDRAAAQDRLRGDGTGASGVPTAWLPVRVELRTIKLPKSLMAPPWPEPKFASPSPPAAPMAELPLSVLPVTVMTAPILLELLSAPPPALAPGLPPAAWFPVNVL